MCFISFIVPVYNLKEEEVRKCILSIRNQTYSDYEIILVDDGSYNGVDRYCDVLSHNGKNFTVIHQENQGLAVARNTGIKIAKGKWIVHVDGDDWVEPNLAEVIKENDSNADILVWGFKISNGSYSQELLLNKKDAFKANYCELKESVLCSILDHDDSFDSLALNTSWAKAYRREFIMLHSLYYDRTLRRAQDAVYNLKAFSIASRVEYIDESLNYYRVDNASLSRGFNPETFNYLRLTAYAVKEFVEVNELGTRVKDAAAIFIQRCFRMTAQQYYLHRDNPMKLPARKMQFLHDIALEPYSSAYKSHVYRSKLRFKVEDILYVKRRFYGIMIYNNLQILASNIKKILISFLR